MARDHTRVNLGIWGDDDFLDLPVDSQALYWRLWTSADRTYCGTHEWKPGKLTQSAGDWTLERLLAAAAVLSERLFLIIDPVTEECLLRSWIKHDGLWKQPNMAVSMANARASVASKTLRGVIVHEVRKLVDSDPNLEGWNRDTVKEMLRQKAIDPASLEPFNPGPKGGVDTPADPDVDPTVNPYGQNGVNPRADTPPTTATSTPTLATATKEGYVSRERHLSVAPDSNGPFKNRCLDHQYVEQPGKCGGCADAREADERLQAALAEAKKAMLAACLDCDKDGWLKSDYSVKCDHRAVS
jgi:hypothetical protein